MAARQPTTMSWTRSNASSWVFEFRLPKVRSRQPPDSGPARGCNHAHASHHETHHFFFFFFFSSPTCFRRLRPKKFHLPTARYFKGPASPKDTAARLSNALFYYQYIYIYIRKCNFERVKFNPAKYSKYSFFGYRRTLESIRSVVKEKGKGTAASHFPRFPLKDFIERGDKMLFSLSLLFCDARDFTAFYTCVIRRPRNKYIEFTHVRPDRYRYDLTDDSRLRNEHRAQLRRLSYARSNGTPLSSSSSSSRLIDRRPCRCALRNCVLL